jgi:hypothetical protein
MKIKYCKTKEVFEGIMKGTTFMGKSVKTNERVKFYNVVFVEVEDDSRNFIRL